MHQFAFPTSGSRKTAGQTGMCGGVRGVGAGGIVSSAYCLLFKLGTLKLTRKQVNGLINHCDSPYIRGLGFMYLRYGCRGVRGLSAFTLSSWYISLALHRYTQPPADLWSWFEGYLDDEEVGCANEKSSATCCFLHNRGYGAS